jgi:toxin ParE1/3/4
MPGYFLSQEAQQDISDIGDYIARDNPIRAMSFVRELRARIGQAAERPLAYEERVELKAGLRAARHRRYLILFRFDGDSVEVLRVLHSARDLAGIFQE